MQEMSGRETYTAIVLSAGSGRRMNSDVPKQYMDLCGYPVIYYSLKAFEDSPVDSIVLVTGEEDIAYCKKEIVDRYGFRKIAAVVAGGSERYLSVYEGIKACQGTDYVLIHDGARPLVSRECICRSMDTVKQEKACVLATPVKDTIKIADTEGFALSTPDRSTLWAMQTPQSFSYSLLMEAYEELFRRMRQGETPQVTDDAMIVEYALNRKIRLIMGNYENIKITTPEDLLVAKMFLKKM